MTLLRNVGELASPVTREVMKGPSEGFINSVNRAGVPKVFTPTWDGFSVDPIGEFSYLDFGGFVIIWAESNLTGTSDATTFQTTGGMPEEIIPYNDTRRVLTAGLVDNNSPAAGYVDVQPITGNMLFGAYDIDGSAGGTDIFPFSLTGWTAASTKGVGGGVFMIMYVK